MDNLGRRKAGVTASEGCSTVRIGVSEYFTGGHAFELGHILMPTEATHATPPYQGCNPAESFCSHEPLFLFMVDCQMMHFYLLLLCYILYAPQGDDFQQESEVSRYLVLQFASSEELS